MKPRYFQLSLDEKQQAVTSIKNILAAEKEILFAFIFGSFDDETDNLPFHDIDVGIYIDGLDKKESLFYSLELSERLSSVMRMPVDIRVLNFAPISFIFYVIRGQLIIDKDEDLRCEFMERAASRYLDIKPLVKRSIKEAFAA
ncbi:MAG: nucleotidyltransferase domain-containing protein [Candidatus Aminicenantes bacterium]|nr:nucleotidyltransferase domain-containing protein [Candidatus Aminicenantes bacterium]